MTSYKEAFNLSKSAVAEATPPGTSTLINRVDDVQVDDYLGGAGHIQLVPKPSQDPADPLNWPMWRKFVSLAIISVYAFLANFQSASIAPALGILVEVFHGTETFSSITHLTSANVLVLGAASLFWVPLGNCFGRRPIMLASLVLLTFSSLWAGKSTSFGSLLAARVIQGVGGSAADTVAPDMVGEMFFVHQGGRAMAIYTVFLAVGSQVGAVAGGYIAIGLGWQWIFYVNAILAGITSLAAFVFMPETMFDRKSRFEQETAAAAAAAAASEQHSNSSNEKLRPSEIEIGQISSNGAGRVNYEPYTFKRSLKIGEYRGNLLGLLLAPFLTLRYPGVWLIMALYGCLVGAIVTVSILGPQLVASPPYLWTKNVGLINLGGIIGGILGALYTYAVVDRLLKRKAQKTSSGFAEPETRLPSMLPSIVVSVAGLLIFGFMAQNPSKDGWVGLLFGSGMLAFTLVQVPSVGFTYLVEAYNAVSGDCLLMVTVSRATISFAFTFFVSDWVASRGAAEPFGIYAMLLGLAGICVVPMWLYGKRTRIATAKWIPKRVDH